ncbi:MAG: iron complex outermembrane receptor protein [Planctomycetota bacterium]|jgi:iron complex outermembrane receptor protein
MHPILVPLLLLIATDPIASTEVDDLDFADLSLEELMNIDIEVTSVSRRSESLANSAAAIYVITAEDIRRSGSHSIPEALRQAPGVNVSRLSTGDYAISVRGNAGEFSNKLLVLIDGRSVYTPLFSGVYWNQQDLPMQDIERIEVIRGPGGTLWGANAVNGVINIITKRANADDADTVSVLVGTEEKLISDMRVSSKLGENGNLRTYVKTTERDGPGAPIGGFEGDESTQRGGFRADWDLTEGETSTLQGGVFHLDQTRSITTVGTISPFISTVRDMREYNGGHLLARWSKKSGTGATTSLQSYFNRTETETIVLDEVRDTFDVEMQRHIPFDDGHSLMFGIGYRRSHSRTVGTPILSFTRASRTDELLSTFVQGEYQATDDLKLIAGTKVEHNDYTQVEIQPSLRFALSRGEDTTLWGAVSRAVRTPAQISHDLLFNQRALLNQPLLGGATAIAQITGDSSFDSEELLAYELGYRTRPTEDTSLDIAAFYHDYSNVQSLEPDTSSITPIGPGVFNLPVRFDNKGDQSSYGTEVAGQWNVNTNWNLHGSYSYILLSDSRDADSASTETSGSGVVPKNVFHLRSYLTPTDKTELDVNLWYVDQLTRGTFSYVRADARLGWTPTDASRLSFGVQGLFHDDEDEFPVDFFGPNYRNEVRAYFQFELEL